MIKKICPHCGKPSYSAVEEGRWICPYCYRDMTQAPKMPLTNEEEEKNEKRAE